MHSRSGVLLWALAVLRTDREGASATIIALLLPVLVGFVALAVEVGSWYSTQQKMQGATDSAAFSGATAIFKGGGATGRDAEVTAVAAKFGLVNGTAGASIVVHQPPQTGAFT